jgi:hypothetical protein
MRTRYAVLCVLNRRGYVTASVDSRDKPVVKLAIQVQPAAIGLS